MGLHTRLPRVTCCGQATVRPNCRDMCRLSCQGAGVGCGCHLIMKGCSFSRGLEESVKLVTLHAGNQSTDSTRKQEDPAFATKTNRRPRVPPTFANNSHPWVL